MRDLLISIVCVFFMTAIKSQDTIWSDFSADRPGAATGPFIVAPGKLQIEAGFSYEKIRKDNIFQRSVLYPTTLFRYGLSSRAEIRLQADYADVKTDGQNIKGLTPFTAATKLFIAEGWSWIPKTALLINLTLPVIGQKNFRPDHLAPAAYLLMQNDLTSKMKLFYNIGIEFDDGNTHPATFLSIGMDWAFSKRLSGFLENYNRVIQNTKPENYLDLGLAYLMRKSIQIDLSGNLNIQPGVSYFMINFGVAWRIPG